MVKITVDAEANGGDKDGQVTECGYCSRNSVFGNGFLLYYKSSLPENTKTE